MKPSELPQAVIDLMSQTDREALGLVATSDMQRATVAATDKALDKAEREIQATVESWLRQNGYRPRTAEWLDGARPERGWYFHLGNPRRNPYLLDLMVWTNGGNVVEFELKTATGRISDEQQAIIKATGASVFRSAQAAIEWLQANGYGRGGEK